MFKSILVPLDLTDTDLAKPAIATAATLSQTWSGTVRLLNVLPMTPVMLAEYVPADFDLQQRQTSEEALAIVARESGIDASRISSVVRQGGIYHEILEEAAAIKADLIVMTSHRPWLQRRPRRALRQMLGAGGAALGSGQPRITVLTAFFPCPD
jgi:nucleotide-binding universal stress UspA family protein